MSAEVDVVAVADVPRRALVDNRLINVGLSLGPPRRPVRFPTGLPIAGAPAVIVEGESDTADTRALDCGRAFDFLSWYRPLTLWMAQTEKPVLEALRRV